MALDSKKIKNTGGTSFEPLDPGAYPARLIHIIDLGLQAQRPYKGQEKDPKYSVSFTYELLDEFQLDEDGNEQEDKPRFIFETMPIYGLGAENAKSTKRYYALDPEETHEGVFSELAGLPCLLTLTKTASKGKFYNNVDQISSMRPKEAKNAAPAVTDLVVFDLDDPDVDVFNTFPDYIKGLIKGNLEFEGSPLAKLLDGATDEEPKKLKEKEVKTEEVSENEEDW